MLRRVSRGLALALPFLCLLAPPASAAEQSIVTLRVTSMDAVLGDLQRIATALEIPLDRDQVIDGAMTPLQFSGAALLDRSRPAAMVFSARGLVLGARALAAVLPVRDTEAALLALENRFETHGVNGSTHTFSRSDGPPVVVRVEDGYLVVGVDPTVVAELDMAAALAGGDLPPGNISLDIAVEELAPLVQLGLMQGRQALQTQMEQDAFGEPDAGVDEEPEMVAPDEEGAAAPEEAVPGEETAGETPEPSAEDEGAEVDVVVEPEFDAQAVMPVIDLYFDFLRDAVANVSRVQISVEVSAEHLLWHERVFPSAGSTLAGLIAAQSGGFPDVARLVDPDGAVMAMAGQVTLTPEFGAALTGYGARYVNAMEPLLASFPDQPLFDQYREMMTGLLPLIEESLQCHSGSMAATVGIDPEDGIRATQIMGTADADACRSLLARTAELLRTIPAQEDGEPLYRVDENALTYAGVSANRQEARLVLPPIESEEDKEAVELLRALFGEDRFVAYWGLADGVLITTMGEQAEQAFKDIVDRRGGAKTGGGLTPAAFAPLATGPGGFVMVDLGTLFETLAEIGGAGEGAALFRQMAAASGRLVFGARFGQGDLNLDVAMPLETLANWGKVIRAEAEKAAEQEQESQDECEDEDEPEEEPSSDDAVPEISESGTD